MGIMMAVMRTVMAVMRTSALSTFVLFLLLLCELLMLLLECHDVRIQHHTFRTVAPSKALPERLGVYLGPRAVRHRRRANQEMWCWHKRIGHLHLVDCRTMLPPHGPMIQACRGATLSVIASQQAEDNDYHNCGNYCADTPVSSRT